jgi:hypothetical protein
MPRWMFEFLLGCSAFLGLALYVVGRPQVAPCLGGPATGMNRCYEDWLANRGLVLQLLDTPIPGIALFLLLASVTWLLYRRTRTS